MIQKYKLKTRAKVVSDLTDPRNRDRKWGLIGEMVNRQAKTSGYLPTFTTASGMNVPDSNLSWYREKKREVEKFEDLYGIKL